MTNLIAGTEFERQLRQIGSGLTDASLRKLVFEYCQLYQEDYSFVQLENAFKYLELDQSEPESVRPELASVISEVEEAMLEYYESLNEVAAAIHRLLDVTPLTIDDTIACIAHLWNAHSCNENQAVFGPREDRVLCELLTKTQAEL